MVSCAAPSCFRWCEPDVRGAVAQNLYNETAARIVDSVLEGFNGTIFAYGQTGLPPPPAITCLLRHAVASFARRPRPPYQARARPSRWKA